MNTKHSTTTPDHPTSFHALARTDLVALYTGANGHERLPVVGMDDRRRLMVATRKGTVMLATSARPDGLSFERVETVSA